MLGWGGLDYDMLQPLRKLCMNLVIPVLILEMVSGVISFTSDFVHSLLLLLLPGEFLTKSLQGSSLGFGIGILDGQSPLLSIGNIASYMLLLF